MEFPPGRIDVHTHAIDPHLPDLNGQFDGVYPTMRRLDEDRAQIMLDGRVYRDVDSRCWSAEARIRDMDAEGVAVQVLSPVPVTLSHSEPAAGAAALARAQNDFLAGLVAQAPDRLLALGCVPLQDVGRAIAELKHCLDRGFVGVEIGTRVGDRELADEEFLPFFEAAAARGATVFVHPVDRTLDPRLARLKIAFGMGMPTETATAAAGLLVAGIFRTVRSHERPRQPQRMGAAGSLTYDLDSVFHNTCTHRGAVVCRRDSGNSKVFQCFYHAWTFDSEGSLVGVPGRDAYGDDLDMSALGLARVARVESYRGFVFACFDPDVVDLVTYLAGAREYLDLVIDANDGQLQIISGTNEYGMQANWKLLVENSIDGYHAASTHDTYFKYLVDLGTDLSVGVDGLTKDLGNGHAVLEYRAPWGRPIARWEPLFGEAAKPEIEALRARLVAEHGAERAARMCDVNRNMLIYPNLVINDIMALTVRTFMPTSATSMSITAWEAAPRNEQPEVRQRRLDSFLTFLGPGGFATPDDIEALESCQQGFASGGVEWNDISRGMGRVAQATDEEQMRAFWRKWRDQMDGVR